MLTLCTMGLLEEIANMAADVTGGFDGLDSLPIKPVFGIFEFNPLYPNTQYLYVLGVLLVCFVFVRMLVYSPYGHSLTGIRENTLRMHAVGAPVRTRLIVCYTISAAIAGIAGALWAQANAYVNLSVLGLDRAATVLIVLVLGGYGRLYGGIVGAVAYMVLSHFLSKAYPTAWQLGLGLLLVVIALFARGGILGMFDNLMQWLAQPREDAAMTALLETRSLSKSFGALARHARRHLRAGGRRAARADRPERRRQDHLHQPPDRRADAERRRGAVQGRGHHPGRAGRAGQARHRPHLPDQPAVPRPLGAGERLHGDRRAGRRRAGHGHARRLAPRRDRRGDGASDAAQARRHRPQDHLRSCPMAASGWSSWPSRSA